MQYFNYKTGEMFEPIGNEEIKFFHLPLKLEFKPNCVKCYGKFHVGFDIIKNEFALCSKCVKKYLDHTKIKTHEKHNPI